MKTARKAGSKYLFEEKNIFEPIGFLESKITLLDKAMGGGLPFGRFSSISGLPGVGKSSLGWLYVSRYLQEEEGMVYYFESEGKPPAASYIFDVFGITDFKKIEYKRYNFLEEVLNRCEEITFSLDKGFIFIDSIAAFGLDPGDSTIKDYSRVGGVASKWTQFMQRGIFRVLSEKRMIFLGINQLRETISMGMGGMHEPGGQALHYSSSLELRLNRGNWIKDHKKEVIGQQVDIVVQRNMFNSPLKRVENIPFYFKYGFHNIENIIYTAVNKELISYTSSGGWYKLNGENMRIDQAVEYYKAHPAELEEIVNKIYQEE
jgi:recombination protein RecA